jgi:FKBP-type peptidyl-prolyl cis-trans isomerase
MTTFPKKLLPLVLSFILTACGGASAPPTIETTTFAPSLNVNLASSTKLANGEYYRTTTAGTGAAIVTGQTLQAHYTVWLADGTQIESNVGAAAYAFQLGAHQVIQDWDEGFVGAHVGDTRQLIIPPELAYGPYGTATIPPNAILVYSVLIDSAQ